MSYRITERSLSNNAMIGLQASLSKMAGFQERMTSGKQMSRPSDSPVGTVSAMQFRTEIRASEQYVRNSDDGLGWLGTADSTLAAMNTQLRRANEQVLSGMSSGIAGSPAAREAVAAELESIRESLIGMANTTYLGRPIFGGTTPGRQAFDQSGTYVGDDGKVTRTVGSATQIDVNVDGKAAFGTGDANIFKILEDVATHLRAGSIDDLTDDLGKLQAASDTVIKQAAHVGARYNRVEQMRQAALDQQLELKSQLSEVEDIDLPQAIMDMQLQETAYKAALAATAKAIQPSLIDFLR